jgi:hypothetical protein
LSRAPAADSQSYLPRRLREALESVLRSGSADQLDEELKYLSELDTGRAQSSGALVRIIIWAIPMLGFLGTVIGMTLAISELSATEMENSLPHVIGGLGVAFDSTTLALSLSITLMFVQFFVDRLERGLLAEVDVRAGNELLHRFQRTGGERDPHIAAFRRLAEDVVHATERLVGRQAELWQSTIADAQHQWQSSVEGAHERWNQLTSQNQLQLETALASALVKGVEAHTHRLVAAEEAVAAENRRHWSSVQQQMVTAAEAFGQRVIDAEHTLAAENRVLLDRLQSTFVGGMERTQLALRDSVERVQQALDVTAETARAQQLELSKQSDILLQVVDATGQVTRLEEALNRNLAALGGAQHLQETLLNLSAAINLLNARLGNVAPGSPQVGLRKSSSVEKAA